MSEIDTTTEVRDDSTPQEGLVSPIPVVPQLSVALALLFFVFGVTYIGSSGTVTKDAPTDDVRIATKAPNAKNIQSLAQVFNGIDIQAESAFVWDVQKQKILFNKDGDSKRPLASITKLMTALISYELLDPKDKVAISQNALKVTGDSGFVDGEEFTTQNLRDMTLISSSNDGAAALGLLAGSVIDSEKNPDEIFVEAMNVRARELGLTKTTFFNSTGLDLTETEAGAYGSARDVALLMEYIITHAKDAVALTNVEATRIKNTQGEYHIAENTNTIVGKLDGLIASKTGYTTLSGGNLVVAVNMGLDRPIVIAVLGSTQEGRFSDTEKLVERVRTYIQESAE